MTPEITNQIDNTTTQVDVQLPSKTYKLDLTVGNIYSNESALQILSADRIAGYVDGLDAMKQAIFHILMIERYAYDIYDENYGIELAQYIGADLEYINTTIEDTLREALTYDLRILDVQVTSVEQVEFDKVLVSFIAYTIYGDLIMEVNINV